MEKRGDVMDEFVKQLDNAEKRLKGTASETGYPEEVFYNKFLDEFLDFNNGGRVPESAGQDLRVLLDCKQKKLKRMGEEVIETYSVPKISDINGTVFSDNKFFHKRTFKNIRRDFSISNKASKRKYLKKENLRFYENIVMAKPEKINDDDKFCCPNCGGIYELKTLEQNCPECQEASFITDLFPKVTNCFGVRSIVITLRKIGKYLLTGGILGFAAGFPVGVIKFILNMPVRLNTSNILDTIFNAFYAPIEGISAGIFAAVIIIIGQLVFKNVLNSPSIAKINETKKIIKTFMLKYDKNFSYENFENKVVYLTQLLIFCDDKENLPVCSLEKRGERYDIIESIYDGIIELKNIKADDYICTMELEVYMSDIHDNGKKIFSKDDVFFMKLQKNLSKNTDINFELKKVICTECGESFDGWNYRFCPNCRKEYHLENDDWIVKEFRLK